MLCGFCESEKGIIALGGNESPLGELFRDNLYLDLEFNRETKEIIAYCGCDEHISVAQKIEYCPMCGRKLSNTKETETDISGYDGILEQVKERYSFEEFEEITDMIEELVKGFMELYRKLTRGFENE